MKLKLKTKPYLVTFFREFKLYMFRRPGGIDEVECLGQWYACRVESDEQDEELICLFNRNHYCIFNKNLLEEIKSYCNIDGPGEAGVDVIKLHKILKEEWL